MPWTELFDVVLTDLICRQVYSRIDFNFLILGRTYGPTDRNFAVIEKYAAKVETVYTLQQWYEHVCNAVMSVGSIKIKMEGANATPEEIAKLKQELEAHQTLAERGYQAFHYGMVQKKICELVARRRDRFIGLVSRTSDARTSDAN